MDLYAGPIHLPRAKVLAIFLNAGRIHLWWAKVQALRLNTGHIHQPWALPPPLPTRGEGSLHVLPLRPNYPKKGNHLTSLGPPKRCSLTLEVSKQKSKGRT